MGQSESHSWAFTDVNASAAYATFFKDISELGQVDWQAVEATSWQSVQDKKQAEFLLHDTFPLELVVRIGVYGPQQLLKAKRLLDSSAHKPTVEIRSEWYY